MGQHKKLQAVGQAVSAGSSGEGVNAIKVFSLPDVPMPPAHQFILEGLAQAVQTARGQLQASEQRCTAFIIDCAERLGVNSSQYMFDSDKRIFTKNPAAAPENLPDPMDRC